MRDETLEPEVKIVELCIISPGRSDIVLPIPEDGKPKGLWFTLKEGSLDNTKEMIGTFSPQPEAYTHFLDDDNKCYLEINYTFDIRKEWAAT
ncbi:hypothetical protein G4B88_019208 [Cannabis sativa]|uniref:Uncharacterized protein n=1 Tax=Cannabis sativa TaxID=3483 RepID=A0A7J6HNW7_CANSA|nr:hypothetical protein G4B88_019208 [Cannabis sativa]